MPRRNRLSHLAVIGWLISALASGVVAAADSQAPAQPEPSQAQPTKANESAKATDKPGQSPLAETGEVAEQNKPEAPVYDPDCGKPKGADEGNFCQQRRSADIAEHALAVSRDAYSLTLWQTAIGAAGLVFVIISLGFSGWAAVAASRAAHAAQDSVAVAQSTAKHELRAYVSVGHFEGTPMSNANEVVVYWNISVHWKNTGATPTKDLVTHVSTYFEDSIIPEDFRFPDNWLNGYAQKNPFLHISPGSTTSHFTFPVSVFQLQQIGRKEKYLFVYGWAEYNDVFDGTARHRTEFCVQVICRGNPTKNTKGTIEFDIYWQHNGADDECMRQPITTVERKRLSARPPEETPST